MPVCLLDTDILTLDQHRHPKVMAAVAAHAQDTVCICTVICEEQISGWSATACAAKTLELRERASRLLSSLITSWSRFALVTYLIPAMLRFEQLLQAKLNVGRWDLKIAAIALELGATVVTCNRRDFGRVPGLLIEDWSV